MVRKLAAAATAAHHPAVAQEGVDVLAGDDKEDGRVARLDRVLDIGNEFFVQAGIECFAYQGAGACTQGDTGKGKENAGEQQADKTSSQRAFLDAALTHIVALDLAFRILYDGCRIIDL